MTVQDAIAALRELPQDVELQCETCKGMTATLESFEFNKKAGVVYMYIPIKISDGSPDCNVSHRQQDTA